ncbi:gibberellin 2beta-dioxygenase [Ranunculus cassubicifolius]
MELSEPPFEKTYSSIFRNTGVKSTKLIVVEECELPLIDLSRLRLNDSDREACMRDIAEASKKWGFFQVVNHGISLEILERMHDEQVKVFRQPFDCKEKSQIFSADSYRWGTPNATSLKQFSWSEAFHIPLTDISTTEKDCNTLRVTIEEFASTVSDLAQRIADILAEQLGQKTTFFAENCLPNTCYLRLNRYPPCSISSEVFGLMPHTDSDFLTILYQDHVGGLQLVKEGRWIKVKPNPAALIINIGDLFQAWSNDVYKSVEHRVMANRSVERFSIAYFLCPSYETVIQSCRKPPVYKEFSFREFRRQVQEDVKRVGYKVGLPRFFM